MEKEIKLKKVDSIVPSEDKAQSEQTALEQQEEKSTPNNISASESPEALPLSNFEIIYNDLHSKFPEIINIEKPVLLAVGIRQEIAYATGIPGVVLNRWIAWYFRKSKYHKIHKQGAKRYNLLGEEVGIVTEEQCQKKAQQMKKIKKLKESALPETTQEIAQDSSK